MPLSRFAPTTTGGPTILSLDFKEFIESLNSNDVRYLVIGGYAMAFHGHPRYTRDLDLWLESSAAQEDPMLDKTPVDFIDVEGLKANKRSTGRLQDLADIERLANEDWVRFSLGIRAPHKD